jgi:hypothetical protein
MKQRMICLSLTAGVWVAMMGPTAFAQDEADRAKLNGAWQAQEGGAAPAVWTIQETASGMKVIRSQGSKPVIEFVCDFGKECEAKDAGKKVKVTLYFNGAKLVVMETRGDLVVKRRFGFGDAADIMELEMIPVAPAGPAQTSRFTRVQSASTAKP